MRALLLKEVREHGWVLAVLYALLGLFFLGWLLAPGRAEGEGTVFGAWRSLALVLFWLGSVAVGHRLVAREYGQRTQLFLEALPLSRAGLLTTKLLTGALVLLLPLAVGLAVAAWLARAQEGVSARFLALLGVRGASLVLLGWTWAALAGLLGRYRVPLYALALLGLYGLSEMLGVDLFSRGPLALLAGADAITERWRWPWGDLAWCWGLTLGAVALCYALALVRDGTLAELVSHRMGHREKVFIASLLLGFCFLFVTVKGTRDTQPFSLEEAEEATEGVVEVQVPAGVGLSNEEARAWAGRIARDVAQLAAAVQLTQVPPIAVLPTRELDPDTFQSATLSEKDGVVVKANLASPALDVPALRAWVMHAVLAQATRQGGMREEVHWLLDGVSTLLSQPEEARLSARVAVAARAGLSPALLEQWEVTMEREGNCTANALAARATQALHATLGDEAFAHLLRDILGRPMPRGAKGLWDAPTVEEHLAAHGPRAREAWLARWKQLVDADVRAHAPLLGRLAGLSPQLTVEQEGPGTFRLLHALVSPAADALPRYSVLTARVGPLSRGLADHELERHDGEVSQAPRALPLQLTQGERWFLAVQVAPEETGCEVRLSTERRDVP